MTVAVLAVALAVQPVAQSLALAQSHPALVVLAAALGAAVGAWLLSLGRGAAHVPLERPYLVAGALAFAFAPWLVITHRYTDAPSGTVVLFLTTSVWGLFLTLLGDTPDPRRASGPRTVAAAAATIAAAAALAVWERPSSFNPFVRFPLESAAFVAAGLAFTAGVALLGRAPSDGGRGGAMRSVAAGAVGAGIVLVLLTSPSALVGLVSPATLASLFPVAVASAFVALACLRVLETASPRRLGVAFLLAPVALSVLSAFESAAGPRGVSPIDWGRALPASVLVLLAAVAVWMLWRDGPRVAGAPGIGTWIGVAALIAAGVGFAAPSLRAVVSGSLSDGSAYRSSFAMAGYETAGGWLAFACALGLLCAGGVRGRGAAFAWAAGVFVFAAGWLVLAGIPLHTWSGRVPYEVQQDYGSEYARIVFSRLRTPWQIAAVGLSVAGLLVRFLRDRRAAVVATSAAMILLLAGCSLGSVAGSGPMTGVSGTATRTVARASEASAAKDPLRRFVPLDLEGFTAFALERGTGVLRRDYVPTDPSLTCTLVVDARRLASGTAAARALRTELSEDAVSPLSDVPLGGVTGYFVTSRASTATVAFVRGNAFVRLDMRADGGDPSALRDDLSRIAAVLAR
ncbi:MAG: hypothetical protein WC971_03250 [Coriobacteriia bacterium]